MNCVIKMFTLLSKMMYLSSKQLGVTKKDAIAVFGNRIKDNEKYYNWKPIPGNFSDKIKAFRSLYIFIDIITYLYDNSGIFVSEDFSKFAMNKIDSDANIYKALIILNKFGLIENVIQYRADGNWCRHIYLIEKTLFFNAAETLEKNLSGIIKKFADDFYNWEFEENTAKKIFNDVMVEKVDNSNINARFTSLLDRVDPKIEDKIKFKISEEQKDVISVKRDDVDEYLKKYSNKDIKSYIEYIINNIDNKDLIINFINENITPISDFAPEIQKKTIASINFDLIEFERIKAAKSKKKYTNKLDQIRNEKIRRGQLSSLEDFIKGYTDIKDCMQDKFAGRLYNALTNIDGDFRRKSELFNEEICEVDISCCQPTLVSALYKMKTGKGTKLINGFLDGSLYDSIVTFSNSILSNFNIEPVNRKEIKGAILKCLFQIKEIKDINKLIQNSDKEISDRRRKDILASLCRDYIKINDEDFYNFIKFIREKEITNESTGKKISLLPKLLQFVEVNFITECIHDYFDKNKNAKFMYTIHDCIAVEKRNSNFMKYIMQKKSENIFGFKFNIKIEE